MKEVSKRYNKKTRVPARDTWKPPSWLAEPTPPAPAPLAISPESLDAFRAMHAAVAAWSIHWREVWGLRSIELEEAGTEHREAEMQAYREVLEQRRSG